MDTYPGSGLLFKNHVIKTILKFDEYKSEIERYLVKKLQYKKSYLIDFTSPLAQNYCQDPKGMMFGNPTFITRLLRCVGIDSTMIPQNDGVIAYLIMILNGTNSTSLSVCVLSRYEMLPRTQIAKNIVSEFPEAYKVVVEYANSDDWCMTAWYQKVHYPYIDCSWKWEINSLTGNSDKDYDMQPDNLEEERDSCSNDWGSLIAPLME